MKLIRMMITSFLAGIVLVLLGKVFYWSNTTVLLMTLPVGFLIGIIEVIGGSL